MNIIQQLEAEQVQKLVEKRPVPEFSPGDTLRVNVKVVEGTRERVQAYEGVCIARKNAGVNSSFTVRKISYGEGVERRIPALQPAHRQHRAGPQGRRPSCQAVLPARAARQARPHQRADDRPRHGQRPRRRELISLAVGPRPDLPSETMQ